MEQPVQSSEMVLEVTYQAQMTPWLMLQPDFQNVIRPGGCTRPKQPADGDRKRGRAQTRSVITFDFRGGCACN